MRKLFFVLALCTLISLPALAQNTDIEALSGLQFNFGNPGARALGMGGAFLGLAELELREGELRMSRGRFA